MYILEIKTDINICDEQFVKSLLNDWYYKINPKLRPERFGQGEPVRKKFEQEGVDSAIKLWLKDKLPLMLKRISNPKFDVDISGYKAPKDEVKKFPSDCIVWLNFKAGDDLTLDLFKFLIEKFKPGFAFISTEDDQKEKHYVKVEAEFGTIEEYVGLEVGEKLPGIYWITYFSRWAVNKIGCEKFKSMNVHSIEEYQDGFLITAYRDSEKTCSQEAKNIENDIINKLGKEVFFDKKLFKLDELFEL